MQSLEQAKELAERLSSLTRPVADLEEALLASATYDGDLRLAVLKFYDQKAGRFWLWRDNTGHKPYCVEGSTLLLGDNVSIAGISAGNHVLGLSGEVLVEGKTVRPYDGDMIQVRACGLLPFRITPEHPVLVARSRKSLHRGEAEFEAPHWEQPANLIAKQANQEGDYLVMPIGRPRSDVRILPLAEFSKMRSGWLKVSEFPISEGTAWLLGLYVAEGSGGSRRGAAFSIRKDEVAIRDKVRRIAKDLGYSAYLIRTGENSVRIHLGGAVIARAMERWCGHGAKNKKIPDFILFHSNLNIVRSFLEGYTARDGSTGYSMGTKARREVQEMSSVSRLLVLQLQQAYARLGIFAHITLQHIEGDYLIQGRTVRQKEAYTVRFVREPAHTRARRVGDFFYVPITRVQSAEFNGSVYNIQTSDSTYLVNNIVVHNCYTRLGAEELTEVRARKDVLDIVEEKKADLLNDTRVTLRKIITTDPLAIGGGNDSIRDRVKAWEADIKYYENYAYDRGLKMGTYYKVSKGEVVPVQHQIPASVAQSLEDILKGNPPEFAPYIREWAELLGEPLCDFRRVALDIEVANEAGRLPDPDDPKQPVIAVSFVNESESTVFLLRGGKDASGLEGKPFAFRVFEEETDLLRAVLMKIMDYPVVVTFNGDDFDLRYLQHRAEKLGIAGAENPIQLERVAATLKHGIHIDLYQFFRNRSIQVYAFSNKYTERTLNGIAEALLNKSKIEFEGEIGDLPLPELAGYCLNDSQLTYELTSMKGSVVMKLLLVISRIGKMPINDVSRLGVSNWIRSMLFYEHRKIGALIPRQDELAEKGGASSQAIIKGKKYKGGLVIEPKPGVFFDVSVLDFASLYPSLIKVHNLSYETVDCPHEECKTNKVPDTTSWVCRKRKGITSLVTGSLRDLRVSYYKPLARDPTLSKDERELYNVVTQGLKVFLNACFTGDTFIMTPTGPKNVKDFAVGDEVLNLNPETLTVEADKVIEVQAFPFEGKMFHFRDRRFVDLCVTPNHRFLVTDNRVGSRTGARWMTVEEVYGRTNIKLPKVKSGIALDGPPRLSLLRTAQSIGSSAYIDPPRNRRLSSWFRTLPSSLRAAIRTHGTVVKRIDKKTGQYRPHYRLPASVVSESDIDAVEECGGRAFLGDLRGSKIPTRLPTEGLASLSGWYVSEGNRHFTPERFYSDGGHRGETWSVAVSQSQGKGNAFGLKNRQEIRELLRRLALPFSTDGADRKLFQISNHVLTEWLTENCYLRGEPTKSQFKRIPEFVFQSRNAMQAFFTSAYKGDGSNKSKTYSTTSTRLAADMATLLTHLGFKTRIKFDVGDGIYRIVFGNATTKLTLSGIEKHKRVRKETYKGMVYCVTTDRNHTVFAGRDGRFVPVGQSYGVMGFETFSFYCLPVAEATAALGRDAITRTIQKSVKLGINVLYGDTDSLFLQNPSSEQIDSLRAWADSELGVELDLDKTYRYVAFSSRKKNYFGVLPDGTPDIIGLTGKKSQTPEYLKETFYGALGILSQVKTEADFERAREETKALLTKMINQLKKKEVPVDKLAFNVMMGKPTEKYNGTTPQHVRAAKLLEERGREIKAGEIIAYVKTKNPPYVKPVELARVDEVDADKYIEYAHSMFDQILDALDFSFDEIMGATTLDFFWS